MQVAHFLLCDGRNGIDRIKPTVEIWILFEMLVTCVGEVLLVLDLGNLLDEFSAQWHDFFVFFAEIVNVNVEFVLSSFGFLANLDCKRSQRSHEEVSSVEA